MTPRVQRDYPIVAGKPARNIVPRRGTEPVGVEQENQLVAAAPLQSGNFQRPTRSLVVYKPAALYELLYELLRHISQGTYIRSVQGSYGILGSSDILIAARTRGPRPAVTRLGAKFCPREAPGLPVPSGRTNGFRTECTPAFFTPAQCMQCA